MIKKELFVGTGVGVMSIVLREVIETEEEISVLKEEGISTTLVETTCIILDPIKLLMMFC
jgi:hypothetical protein